MTASTNPPTGIRSRRRGLVIVSLLAAAIAMSACTATTQTSADEPASPSPSPSAVSAGSTPSPSPSLVELTVPKRVPGELARVVFVDIGPDGVPTSTSEISDAPERGVEYTVEGRCVASDPATRVSFTVESTEDRDLVVASEFACDGVSFVAMGALGVAGTPMQVSFTKTDGATQAYVRIVPSDALD